MVGQGREGEFLARGFVDELALRQVDQQAVGVPDFSEIAVVSVVR